MRQQYFVIAKLLRLRCAAHTDLAQYSIVTYEFSLSGAYSISSQFETAGLSLDASLTARDADVIKTYVRVGLGIGAG